MNDFAERLRYARAKRGISQAALAKASGVSQSAIASYEARTRRSSTAVVDIAKSLNVDPIWLLTGQGAMLPTPTVRRDPLVVSDSDKLKPYPQANMWPFKNISQETFWSLSDTQREMIEDTIGALIKHLDVN